MDWSFVAGMALGGFFMFLGVILGGAIAIGGRTRDSEDIDIP